MYTKFYTKVQRLLFFKGLKLVNTPMEETMCPQRREVDTINNIDQTRELPQFILHHILSFLSTKQAAQTSILSKTWLRAWTSHPILDFDQSYFAKHENIQENTEKFFNFVDQSLLRYREQSLRIKKFRLHTAMDVDGRVASLVSKWTQIATENGVVKLEILVNSKLHTWYTLPQTIFSTKSITFLKIGGFKLEQPIFRADIKLYSLQELYLYRVHVDEPTIQNLISCCPSIESFCLHYCRGLKKFHIYGLHKIKLVHVIIPGPEGLETVDIKAPTLESFRYGNDLGQTMPCMINVTASPNLKELSLAGARFRENSLHDFISSFPLLESLCLRHCNMLKRIKISSPRLKNITISYCRKLVKTKIVAPSLISVHYNGFTKPSEQNMPCTLDVSASKNLKTLYLGSMNITDGGFHDLVSKFPHLENMCLDECNLLERIKISSPELKNFKLFQCKKLVEAKIDSPNLVSFDYMGDQRPLLSSTCTQGQWSGCLKTIYHGRLDAFWFLNLREFLTKSNQFKVLTLCIWSNEIAVNMRELLEIPVSPIYEVEHMKLVMTSRSSSYSALMDGLFFSCHPRIFDVLCQSKYEFKKFIFETLTGVEDLQCCSSSHIKCWRHSFKDVEIEGFGGAEDDRTFHNWQIRLRLRW